MVSASPLPGSETMSESTSSRSISHSSSRSASARSPSCRSRSSSRSSRMPFHVCEGEGVCVPGQQLQQRIDARRLPLVAACDGEERRAGEEWRCPQYSAHCGSYSLSCLPHCPSEGAGCPSRLRPRRWSRSRTHLPGGPRRTASPPFRRQNNALRPPCRSSRCHPSSPSTGSGRVVSALEAHLVFEAVARPSGARPGRVAALRHEPLDDTVERDAVVEAAPRQGTEAVDGPRGLLGVELNLELASLLQFEVQYRTSRRLSVTAG